jgi:hypothetical protein
MRSLLVSSLLLAFITGVFGLFDLAPKDTAAALSLCGMALMSFFATAVWGYTHPHHVIGERLHRHHHPYWRHQ